MAKSTVSQWDVVADNNTRINGINIDENCPPSAINNAIREVMAQVKQWKDGYTNEITGETVYQSLTVQSIDIKGVIVLKDSSGTDGQVITSKGPYSSPAWTTLGTMSSQNSNAVNITGGSVKTTGDLNVTGSLKLDNALGNAGQVLVSSGSAATPTWGNAFVRGMIMLWSGSTGTVPSGWALCNGASGTPDLRNRFVIGAGSSYAVGAKGGSANATLVSHSHTVSGTAAASSISGTAAASSISGSVAAGGGHTHSASTSVTTSSGLTGWWDFKNRGGSSYATPMLAASSGGKCTHKNQSNSKSYGEGYRGEGGSGSSRASINMNHNHTGSTSITSVGNHTHTMSGTAAASSISGTAAASSISGTAATTGASATNANLPPYYALCYIMKL